MQIQVGWFSFPHKIDPFQRVPQIFMRHIIYSNFSDQVGMQQTSKKKTRKLICEYGGLTNSVKFSGVVWGKKSNQTTVLSIHDRAMRYVLYWHSSKQNTRKTGQSSFKFTSFEFPMTFEPFFGKRIHSLVWLTGNCVGVWCSSWLQPFWGSMRCPSLDPHGPRLPWYHEIGCGIPGVPQADPTNRACRCEESLYLAIQVVMVPQFSKDLPIRLETAWLFPKKSSLVKPCIRGKHPNEQNRVKPGMLFLVTFWGDFFLTHAHTHT